MILYKTNLVKGGKEDQIEQVTGQLSQTLPTKVFKKTIKQFFFQILVVFSTRCDNRICRITII